MNRLLELERGLTRIRDKRKSKSKNKSKGKLSSATSFRTKVRQGLSHGMKAFTDNGLNDGNVWLQVKAENFKVPTDTDPNNTTFSLSQFMRVKDVSKKNGREYFTIVDGLCEGKKASVKALDSGSRFSSVSYDTGGTVKYNRAKKELTFGTAPAIKAYMSDPLPAGDYKLRLPDYPHAGGNNYTKLSKYATVWFKIEGNDNLNRYLHVGSATAGCCTCGEAYTAMGTNDDRKRWTEVYDYLIKRRLDKGRTYVGKLIVE
jgi:hypothetical protein